jgi:predicted transcriptional regulator of viral defense system
MHGKPDLKHLFQLAEPQGGYFTASQAQTAGYSRQRLSYHVRAGQFTRIAQGIYRLALYPSSPYEDLHMALLRTGPASVVSHESALAFYGLSDILPKEIHLTVPRTSSRRRARIRLHTRTLRAGDIARREGLRLTTVARTIADVASAGLAEEHVIQAVTEALQRGLVQAESLEQQAQGRGGRAAALIRQALHMQVLN